MSVTGSNRSFPQGAQSEGSHNDDDGDGIDHHDNHDDQSNLDHNDMEE